MKRSFYLALLAVVFFNAFSEQVHGMLAGGRPNAISGGHNSFAGVVNPANAVWIEDRIDMGVFLQHQQAYLNNKDNNPFFPPGRINQTYKTNYLVTGDAAIHKGFKACGYEYSLSLATYATPGYVKLHTKEPLPLVGTTPLFIEHRTQVLSSIFSLKLNESHSIGISLDYFYLSYRRNGFQRIATPLRSVSPHHVTNNGMDHSSGLGLSLGWRWFITKQLIFGFAFVKKSYVGQFRKYRGYEPHHARNYIPETIGGGFTYLFSKKLAGRLEVLWTGYGSLPNANNTVLSDGLFNTNKRGSNDSPGSGLQDATFINAGLGYKVTENLSLGAGVSHRIKLERKSPYIISRNYMRQTIYDLVTLGINYNYLKNDFFISFAHGFENRESGVMPIGIGGGKFTSTKRYNAMSIAWGYLY